MKKLINLHGINESLIVDGIIPILPMRINENKGEIINQESLVKNISNDINKNSSQISSDNFGWVNIGGKFFLSNKTTDDTIPPGLYNVETSYEKGAYLSNTSVKLDELYKLPNDITDEVLKDLTTFWNSKDKYDQYGITYKRGIILYGEPGTGKTSLLNLIIHKVITEYNGIAINMQNIDSFVPIVNNIRYLDPEKPIVAIIEDMDSFLQYNSVKQFLNLLDGNMQIDNVIYIATTNYIDQIEPRIKNRPSRFDRQYYVSYPDAESRKFFIENKLTQEDKQIIDIEKWVRDTENMSFSHIKELIISVLIMNCDYNKTIKTLRTMQNL